MSTTTLTYSEWFKAVRRHATDDRFPDFSGYPIADVAERLKVTKQAVHHLLEKNHLDAIAITTKAGNVAVTLITQASLDYYLAHRKPLSNDGRFILTPDPV